MFGHKIEELEKEELIAIISWLHEDSEKLKEMHAELSVMRMNELRDARLGEKA